MERNRQVDERYLAFGAAIRSGTSVGAHFEESRGAESKADFIHKLGMQILPLLQISELLQESNEIVAMLTASVITAKGNHVRG